MNRIKLIILFSTNLILTQFCLGQKTTVLSKQVIDLNNDNKKEEISVFDLGEKLYLKIDTSKYLLIGDNLNSIIDTTDLDKTLLLEDINNDGIKEILLSTGHPIFEQRQLLYIFQYTNNKISIIDFHQKNKKFESIDTYKQPIFDNSTKKIYVPFKREEIENKVYFYIDCYKWNLKTNHFEIIESRKKLYVKGAGKYYKKFIW